MGKDEDEGDQPNVTNQKLANARLLATNTNLQKRKTNPRRLKKLVMIEKTKTKASSRKVNSYEDENGKRTLVKS